VEGAGCSKDGRDQAGGAPGGDERGATRQGRPNPNRTNAQPIDPAPAIPALLQALPPPAPKGIESPPADSSTYWAGFAEGLAAAIAHSPGDIPAALEEVELFMHESDGGKGRNFTGVMAEIGAGDVSMSAGTEVGLALGWGWGCWAPAWVLRVSVLAGTMIHRDWSTKGRAARPGHAP
jgi:hypothetical protein